MLKKTEYGAKYRSPFDSTYGVLRQGTSVKTSEIKEKGDLKKANMFLQKCIYFVCLIKLEAKREMFAKCDKIKLVGIKRIF